jgi:hypothetical protein
VDVARRLCAGMNDQSEIFVELIESSKVSDAGNSNNFQEIDGKKLSEN